MLLEAFAIVRSAGDGEYMKFGLEKAGWDSRLISADIGTADTCIGIIRT